MLNERDLSVESGVASGTDPIHIYIKYIFFYGSFPVHMHVKANRINVALGEKKKIGTAV